MNIPDRWIAKLDMLPPKDFKTLVMAILRDESEPEITGKLQHIATDIYVDRKRAEYHKLIVRKARNKVTETSLLNHSDSHSDGSSDSHKQVTVIQEEKREASPPSSPSSSPPHPLNNTPYNPPLEREKREDSPSSLTLTNPQGGDISLERADNTAKIPLPERFDKLWEKYPRKIGKKRAFDAYKKAIKSGTTDEVIADGIERYRQYVESRKFEEKYIKQGSTWFAGECWNDEYDISARQLTADEEREYQELWGG